ncbi:LOW QUALITY PROTEIN: hypothetical protein CVT25_005516 [Psilocybe cyanescens]|uniref:Uncharacterized protein n=1 Tax=Psilocybe cyanescens TaxID=93625 RepID=A0A409X6D9_PSICY|nr:LOW QUALITY PROTEIN: hypothetical protein CVT25_005516 [Psilocybe cyanescens]
MGTIDLLRSIDAWNDILCKLGESVERANSKFTERRREHMELVSKAMKKIKEVNALHDEVIKRRTTPDQRVNLFVLHSEKTVVSGEPRYFTQGWPLIEQYDDKVYWSTFKWNKAVISRSPTLATHCPFSPSIKQAAGTPNIVSSKLTSTPRSATPNTGTTVCCTNGLQLFTPIYAGRDDCGGIAHYTATSIEIAVLSDDYESTTRRAAGFPSLTTPGPLSSRGMSASSGCSLAQALLTKWPTSRTSPPTTYWWVEQQQITAEYPGCVIYDEVVR